MLDRVTTLHIRASVLGSSYDIQSYLLASWTDGHPNNVAALINQRLATTTVRNPISTNKGLPGHYFYVFRRTRTLAVTCVVIACPAVVFSATKMSTWLFPTFLIALLSIEIKE